MSIACENIRFSSLYAAGDVSRETSPATKSEEKRMFSQAIVNIILGYLELFCNHSQKVDIVKTCQNNTS